MEHTQVSALYREHGVISYQFLKSCFLLDATVTSALHIQLKVKLTVYNLVANICYWFWIHAGLTVYLVRRRGKLLLYPSLLLLRLAHVSGDMELALVTGTPFKIYR